MSKIEISVAVDATKPEELKALSNYLLALANLSGVKTPETNTTDTTTASEVKESEPSPAAAKKRQVSKAKTEAPKEEQETTAAEAAKEETPEEKVKEAAAKAAKAAKEETPEEKVKEAATIKLDTLRTLLSKKVDANRDAIKDKLTELGTKNLTTLDPKDYQTMYDFFISLKDSE